ncbi:hypothetical protein Hsw_3065 [Hymenobacter swuensis DY53]|uniref:Uncharacterized protein n=1 Tax=Hymenobacter swuensis DY53 TaxID=1227739 RepID=W8FAC0_9BACT|nr:hypothetical protein Hsw_3065 [Hymenobacter swuensis DY53]
MRQNVGELVDHVAHALACIVTTQADEKGNYDVGLSPDAAQAEACATSFSDK